MQLTAREYPAAAARTGSPLLSEPKQGAPLLRPPKPACKSPLFAPGSSHLGLPEGEDCLTLPEGGPKECSVLPGAAPVKSYGPVHLIQRKPPSRWLTTHPPVMDHRIMSGGTRVRIRGPTTAPITGGSITLVHDPEGQMPHPRGVRQQA